jgi:hypothetical protein
VTAEPSNGAGLMRDRPFQTGREAVAASVWGLQAGPHLTIQSTGSVEAGVGERHSIARAQKLEEGFSLPQLRDGDDYGSA